MSLTFPLVQHPLSHLTLTIAPLCPLPLGHPTPRAVWDKDSLKLQEGGRYKMEAREETRTLEIPKVTQQDAGLYRVTIENDLGREQATARLDVISECQWGVSASAPPSQRPLEIVVSR